MPESQEVIQPQLATTEGVTKQECFQIPGSQSWEPYKGQENIPKHQRLGTCYHEGSGD